MKRLIIFLLLFAAIKVAGQTTGYLRFDTVRIYKQNGTCELYIINKTKDSTGGVLTNIGGGLTSFKKSRVNGDSLFVGGDTVVLPGGSTKLDSVTISTAADPDPDTLYQWRVGLKFLVGLIPKGGGASDTTIVEKPIYVRSGTNDTLALQYHDGLTINDDSVLTVSLKWVDSVRRRDPYLYRMVSVLYNAGIIVIGNSISQTGTTPYETFANMFAKAVGGPYNNYSIPGGDAQILGDMLRNNRLPFGRTQAALYNNHVNVIRFEMSSGVRLWVKNAVRSFLINCFKAQSTDASAMSVAAGSWASFNGLTATSTSKTDCRVTVDSLAELAFTVKDNQPGLFIVFQTNGPGDTDWSDSVGIYRSGGSTLLATVNPNKQAHIRGMPFVVWLPKTDVFTSIRIRNLKADTLVVDYAGTTALNNNIAPALVAEITHVATAALQPGIPHSWWDTVNADMRSVVEDEFVAYGYPAAIFDVNSELEYDNPVYFHELLTTPTSAIHPSTYAHQNAILPQLLGRVVLRSSEKKSIEYATDVSTYSAGIGFQGQEKVIILPSISQNSGLNYAADSFAVSFGQRLTVINDNSNLTFNWNAVFWTFVEPNGATGTNFPNKSVTEMIWTRQGFRVTNRYAVDSVTTSNDTTYIKVNGKRHFFVHQGGGGGGTPGGADTEVQYNASGTFGAEAAFNYNSTTNKLVAGDSVSTTRLRADQLIPLTGNTFGLRSLTGNPLTFSMQNNSGTGLLNTAIDGSLNITMAGQSGTGTFLINSVSGQNMRIGSGGGVIATFTSTGLLGLNEISPTYKFQSFDNATAQTSSRRAVYGINQTTINTTGGAIVNAGVFGFDNSTRSSGSNNLTNVGVYGLGQAGGQLSYGMVSEAMTSTTNAVIPSMRIISNSTGTAANGFGTGFFLGAENGSAANVNIAEVQAVYTDVTSTSEDADIIWRTVTAGSLTEKFRLLGGTARFSGGLQLGSLSNGSGSDSILVINGTDVKKISPSAISSSAAFIYQFASTQQITVSNTTTETTIYGTGFGSAGIDGTANVTAGSQIILKGAGTISTAATAGEVTFAFKFPTSTISVPVTGMANNLVASTYTYEYKAIPLGTGTSQDYIWFLDIFVENNGTPVVIKVTGRETAALTTTGTLTMNVTVDWNTADADNTVVANYNTVEVVKK